MLGGENMPVIGLKRPEEEQAKTREIKMVNAMLVKPSSILPKRDSSREVMDSVKRDGVQQPIIVRPHPEKEGEYEIIDGHNRWYGITEVPNINNYVPGREPEILVDIRYGLTDADVFKLSNIMHKRKERNTYEQAEFYVKWIEAKAKELGKEEGALTEVAKELIDDVDSDHPIYPEVLNSKQSLLSQYVKVYELFKTLETLEQKYPDKFEEIDLNAIKHIGLTRLYALTKLIDNPLTLIKVVQKLSKNPDMTLERLKELTEEHVIDRSKTPWSAVIRLSPDISKDFKSALYKFNPKVFESSLTNNEILRDATKCLIKLFVDRVEDFEVELEKTKDGNKITAIWMRTRTYEPAQEIKLIPKT
jgi:ParB/RepB/Spo0J family partition protein